MTQDQITTRLGEILDVLADDAGHRGVLSSGERVAAAIALERDDWIKEDGFATIAAARAWIDAGTLAYDVSARAPDKRAPMSNGRACGSAMLMTARHQVSKWAGLQSRRPEACRYGGGSVTCRCTLRGLLRPETANAGSTGAWSANVAAL